MAHLTRFCRIDSIIYTPTEKTKFTDELLKSLIVDYDSLNKIIFSMNQYQKNRNY